MATDLSADWRHLRTESARAKLIRLRDAVAPILANNLIPHFTDHTVTHSDSVCGLVDQLIAPLQRMPNALSDEELVILYAAGYLHDIGMQYEAAYQTQAIQSLSLPRPWAELSVESRRDLLRRHHHLISAEMVSMSVRAERPPVGLQLASDYHPSYVAALCECHVLDTESNRYQTLMRSTPSIRMPLLSGLLRMADILDESRRRAMRSKADTLLLNLESQTHWWRHYYTEMVQFDEAKRRVTLWFDYPPTRFEEYSRVVPALQLPWIQAELNRHGHSFAEVGLIWTLDTASIAKPYSDTEQMPESVVAEMQRQRSRQRQRDQEIARQATLRSFVEARPFVQRRLEELHSKKDGLAPRDYLMQLFGLSNELWEIGSKRSAWMALVFEFERSYQHLDDHDQVRIGARLLEMMIDDNAPDWRIGWIEGIASIAQRLSSSEPSAARFLTIAVNWYVRACAYDLLPAAVERAITLSQSDEIKSQLRCVLNEAHFLQGELGRITEE